MEPPQANSTDSNLVDMGRATVHVHLLMNDSETGVCCRLGGHDESLRRSRGEAVGEQLDASSINRSVVNVGTDIDSPSLLCNQHDGGQVCRQLMNRYQDGGFVVVRGRESRLHGEGIQQNRSGRTEIPGGRR